MTDIPDGHRMGPPTPGAIMNIQRMVNEGHQIVIFTARNVNRPEPYKAVEDWLVHFGIPFHGITNVKQPYFDVMLDNRGLRFTDWPKAIFDLKRIIDGRI